MQTQRIVSALLGAAIAMIAAQAVADNCKSPNLKVVNDKTSSTIKVTKIQYFDECDNKWRTENLASTEIRAGGHYAIFHDSLEYVGGCQISKFKLFRSVRKDTGGAYDAPMWGGEIRPDEGSRTCQTNVTYTLRAKD
jgi:hypothetical protein